MLEAQLTGIKVLVIDDSPTIRRSAELLLTPAGCSVIIAEDGFAALSQMVKNQPDIIFIDIMMPRLDGYQTCAVIKRNPRFKATPVIMLSSRDGLFDRARGRLAGADQYITKPFSQPSLLTAVHAQLPALGLYKPSGLAQAGASANLPITPAHTTTTHD